jgi:hypothetical protein
MSASGRLGEMAETWGAASFEDFSAKLGFSLSDLQANRAGSLSPDQRLRIARLISKHASSLSSQRTGFLLVAWAMAGWMVIGLIAALVRSSLEPLASVLLCGLMIPILLVFAKKPPAVPPEPPEQVWSVAGPVDYRVRGVGTVDVPQVVRELIVGERVFNQRLGGASYVIPPVFLPGLAYRVYFVMLDLRRVSSDVTQYTARFPLLLSAERV